MSKLHELLTSLSKARNQNIGVFYKPDGTCCIQLGFGEIITGDEALLIAKLSQLLLEEKPNTIRLYSAA